MSTKIQKWGNSLGVRIPKSLILKLNLKDKSLVDIEQKNGVIIIQPKRHEYTLSVLLNGITKENLPKEEDFVPEGKEVW